MPRNDEIRANIISATRQLMNQKPAITIREIADACFVNVAAVNYYFGTKDRLLAIVLEDIIKELKEAVTLKLAQVEQSTPIETVFEMMVDYIYSYATENIGLIAFLILNVENRDLTSRMFVNAFFTEGDFKGMVFTKLREVTGLEDDQELYARYVLLFSCFVMPLLIQLLQNPGTGLNITDLKNEQFKKQYIRQLVRMVR